MKLQESFQNVLEELKSDAMKKQWDETTDALIESYYETHSAANIQLEGYNHFITFGIQDMVSRSPDLYVPVSPTEYWTFKFDHVHVSSPGVHQGRTIVPITPQDARERNLTYESAVHVNIVAQRFVRKEAVKMGHRKLAGATKKDDEPHEELPSRSLDDTLAEEQVHERVLIAHIPTMVRSCCCVLFGKSREDIVRMGECDKDPGGYFIVRGLERFIVSLQRPNYNSVLVHEIAETTNSKYAYKCEIRSVAEESGYSVVVQVMLAEDRRRIFVSLPNIKEPMHVGVVFKAMGFTAEEDMVDFIGPVFERDGTLCAKAQRYIRDILQQSHTVDTREDAIELIAKYPMYPIQKDVQTAYARQIVEMEMFPHLGITATLHDKAEFLGYMVNILIQVATGIIHPDNRDHVCAKRIDTPAALNMDLVWSNFETFTSSVEKTMRTSQSKRSDVLFAVEAWRDTFTKNIRYCYFTGNWGVKKSNKMKVGVVQILPRMSFQAMLSSLRHIVIPIGKLDKSAKLRQIHTSQIGFVCPSETPEGQQSGIVTNYAVLTRVSLRESTVLVKECIFACKRLLSKKHRGKHRVLHNGAIVGTTNNPKEFVKELASMREKALFSPDVSVVFNGITVNIYSDEGRMLRPLYVVRNNKIYHGERNWDRLMRSGAIRYVDAHEIEQSNIAMRPELVEKYPNTYDFCEIDPASMLGVCASAIPFPDHTQSTRNCFQCVATDTPVLMADGTQRPIANVCIGDAVVCVDPSSLQVSTATVINQYVRPTDKKMLRITLKTGETLVCTDDHPILSITWCKAGDLCVGDTVYRVPTLSSWIFWWRRAIPEWAQLGEVANIEPHGNVMIADITVDKDVHSFVANGIVVHNSSMGKQALGIPLESFNMRFDSLYIMHATQKPIVSTRYSRSIKITMMTSGINVIAAIMPWQGFNQEDSVILNQSSLDRGLFYVTAYFTITDEEQRNSISEFQSIELPPVEIRHLKNNYSYLDETGIVRVGTRVRKDDVLIGKVITRIERDKAAHDKRDASVTAKNDEEGVVDRVKITQTNKGWKMVRIVIRQPRASEVGDKFASREAQKGTCGMTFRQEDMPFSKEGIVPDLMLNPHCIPSRMTINHLGEMVVSKVCALTGSFADATPFTYRGEDVAKKWCQKLRNAGMNSKGLEVLYNPHTGRKLQVQIFMGPIYYQKLKHMVAEKIHSRDRGHVTLTMRQPTEGRTREGGLRFGEMERDCILFCGSASFLKERLFYVSDPYTCTVCDSCGEIASTPTECRNCKTGKLISVNIPYASKLLFQELNAMGIRTGFIPKRLD